MSVSPSFPAKDPDSFEALNSRGTGAEQTLGTVFGLNGPVDLALGELR